MKKILLADESEKREKKKEQFEKHKDFPTRGWSSVCASYVAANVAS